jgi:hypothetical protein
LALMATSARSSAAIALPSMILAVTSCILVGCPKTPVA